MPGHATPSRARKIWVFVFVLVAGFAMFAIPAIFFQMGNAGGYQGANLAFLGVIQLVLVGAVVGAGLRMLGMRVADIGLTFRYWSRDALLGVGVAAAWAVLQYAWVFPATGGAARADIAGILDLIDGSWHNVLWYLPLGILGGGVAEELYNRGFVITVLSDILGNTAATSYIAGAFSVLFFAAGHLPQGWVDWVDILIPSTAYVVLFLYTRRLIAPMVAHAVWNTLAFTGIHLIYG
jgi:membrane protease YdiL (CAAX protease family)